MTNDIAIVFLNTAYPGNSNGAIRRRIALRVDGTDRDVTTLRLDSDRERWKQAKRWGEAFSINPEDIGEKLRDAALVAAAEAQDLTKSKSASPEPAGGKNHPHPHTLDEVRDTYSRWIRHLDGDLVDVVFGAALAHRLDGDPVWLFIIAAPGDGKTESLRSLAASDDAYMLSTLTPGSLISGYIVENGPDPSLLPKLDRKILIVKDFTAILTMPSEARTEILGTLRDAFDGEASKAFGTGETRKYRSRFGLIAAVTPVIDRYWGVSAQLGERFLRFRLDVPGRDENENAVTDARVAKTAAALMNSNDETRMRDELSAAALSVLAQTPAPAHVPAPIETELVFLADFVALARSEVARDRHGVVEYVPAPEVGTRVGKQLKKLAVGIAMARGLGTVNANVMRIVRRVARDTVPSMRARLLGVLWGTRGEQLRTAEVGELAEVPTATAKTWLDDLRLLGMVCRGGDQHAGYLWALAPNFVATCTGCRVFECSSNPPSDFAPLTPSDGSPEPGVSPMPGGDSYPLTTFSTVPMGSGGQNQTPPLDILSDAAGTEVAVMDDVEVF